MTTPPDADVRAALDAAAGAARLTLDPALVLDRAGLDRHCEPGVGAVDRLPQARALV